MTKKSNFYFVIPESEIIGCEFRITDKDEVPFRVAVPNDSVSADDAGSVTGLMSDCSMQ